MLKRYQDQGCPESDQPLLAWALHDSVNRIETALSGALRNFPIRPVGWLLWLLVFPLGRRAQPPGDRLRRRAASILMTPGDARARSARSEERRVGNAGVLPVRSRWSPPPSK